MRMLYYFVVELPSKFRDEIEFADTTLKIETKFNEFEHRVNEGKVVSVPYKYDTDVKPGDTLYFHHLVVINGGIPFEGFENQYLVIYDPNVPINSHAFAYRPQGTTDVIPLPGWSILAPCIEDAIESALEIVEFNPPLPTRGELAYENEDTKELGVAVGDIVGFRKNMDYRFKIDGEEFYRTRAQDLLYAV